MDGWMSTSEASRYLKLSTKTVRKLAASGSIRAYKVCGRWRFRREDLDAFVLEIQSKRVVELVNRALGGGKWK
ncbi:helix-turn-helix domain-containing protein [Desulfurobacterium sp. TC5-1]|uniref:helix-turn-helix domain-containing protein n=1 Tax=Desulfurobacterium sp. TC5-1 TaxID=1158318 RepID=UPI0003B4B53A|nr:helix-turn-helix domain-containing protein [Desulfurobacterium sp. TC5-1]